MRCRVSIEASFSASSDNSALNRRTVWRGILNFRAISEGDPPAKRAA